MADLVVSEAAENEYEVASRWYADRNPAAADGFTLAVAAGPWKRSHGDVRAIDNEAGMLLW